MQILNLFAIVTQICPFSLENMWLPYILANITWETEKDLKIQELYPLVQASSQAAQIKKSKTKKKVQKAKNIQAPSLVRAEKNLYL